MGTFAMTSGCDSPRHRTVGLRRWMFETAPAMTRLQKMFRQTSGGPGHEGFCCCCERARRPRLWLKGQRQDSAAEARE